MKNLYTRKANKNCMAKTFKVLIYPGEDGYFVAECPELPGCITQGKTETEALENAKEAVELYLESTDKIRTVNLKEVTVAA